MKNSPIICLEGPSGVGKTTLCQVLSNEFNIVPEVNQLFERPVNEPKYWYHEKQVERYELCQQSNKPSILDGDIFQPIWYNWVCNYPANFLSKEETHAFYKAKLLEGKISFPDLYIIFDAEEKELWNRKERDKTRRRRNFEKHLTIIQPLRTYYRFLEKETDLEMRFIYYSSITETKEKVLSTIQKMPKKKVYGVKVFEQIDEWISKNNGWVT